MPKLARLSVLELNRVLLQDAGYAIRLIKHVTALWLVADGWWNGGEFSMRPGSGEGEVVQDVLDAEASPSRGYEAAR